LTILPARNIQTLDLNESFISRWFGVASLEFGVAGGSGHSVPAIPRERARQLRSELLSSSA
jgi:putative membrane protein